MKRKFTVFIIAIFAFAAAGLIIVQVVQTNQSVAISNNLFSISVSNAMDDVIDQLNRLKVEDYISQKDRYKLLKYKRIEDLTNRMQSIVRDNASLFYDETRVAFGTALQDSVIPLFQAKLSTEEREVLDRYNTLLGNRNKLTDGSEFYDRFVNELSEYVIDNIMSNSEFSYSLLDTLIVEKLIENGVDIHPTIGVINATKDEFLYCSNTSETKQLLLSPYRYSFRPDGMLLSNDYLIVLYFPPTVLFLKDNMSLFLFVSTCLILIIFILFVISVRIINNQRKLDEMKNDFISNMTHEIKTPIATIGLACEMLQDKSISCDETYRDNYIGMIGNENRRMRTLVETILQSSKMSNKNFSLSYKETDIHTVINEVSKSLTLSINNRQGTIETDLKACPSTIYADELHITNMIYNLLDNAIKYSPNEVYIKISTLSDNGKLIITVSDHGMGISKEDIKHIFEKFYRVNTGDVHNVKGFGIGLNYVRQVVMLHHGTIDIESELGKGTSFIITIPAA